MGKASRQKTRLRAARMHPVDKPERGRDASALQRLIDMDRAAVTRDEPSPDGLPIDYVDRLRAAHDPIFQYADVDLQRMRETGEDPEHIFPPYSRCNEEPYAEQAVRSAAKLPGANRWLANREAIKAFLDGTMAEYRAVLSFLHAGSKTYFFSGALAESLSYTALNMPAPALKLPVPAFEFVFHSEAACEAFHASLGTPVRAVRTISVFVREDTLKEVGFRRLIVAAYEHDDAPDKPPVGLIRRLAMREDWDLESALNTDWSKPGMGPRGDGFRWETTPDGGIDLGNDPTANFLDEKVRFMRMVMNGILYVTSRGAEITEKLATRAIRTGGHRNVGTGTHLARSYSSVGESIKQIPVVIDPTVRYDPLTHPSGKRSVRVRFLVPGFWRRPPNSAPDARKDVWVSAHFRGPEMADLVNNPYVVR